MRYRVWMHSRPAVCRTFYDGYVDVVADNYQDAVRWAIDRAARVHGHRDFIVDNVEVKP